IAALAPKAGISWLLLSLSHPSEEGLEGQVHTHGDVVQDLAVHSRKAWTLLFQCGQGRMLGVQTEAGSCLLVGRLAERKEMDVQAHAAYTCPADTARRLCSRP